MLKVVTVALLLTCVMALAACENAAAPRTAAASQGTQLGDSGVRVSGALQAGGAASIR